MTRSTRIFSAPAILVIAAGAFLSSASIASASGPLSGPDVDAQAGPKSLVERNIDGSMRRPEMPVAEAAVQLVALDQATQQKVDTLLAKRAAAIDAIVSENMQTLNQFRTDRAAAGKGENQDRSSRRQQGQKLMEMFKPVLAEGPLEEQIAALLPDATRASYLAKIEEHRTVMQAERRQRGPNGRAGRGGQGGAPRGMDDEPMLFEDPSLEMEAPRPQEQGGRPGGNRGRSEGARMMGEMQGLQLEIRRSVERIRDDGKARTDDFLSQLGLDPEQEAEVRALMQKGRQAGNESDDPRTARRETMRQISEILTPEQREKFREVMSRQRGGEKQRNRRQSPKNKDSD